MNRYKFIILYFVAILLTACSSHPKDFTYRYQKKATGLSKLINTNGYYIAQHECDSTFYSVFMFFEDGLFNIATTSEVSLELISCFELGGTSNICKYPLWGIYQLEDNIIRTQVLRPEAGGCTIFRDYKILSDGNIINISDYVQPEYTNLGYMENYPSFRDNPCKIEARFYPTATKRDSTECPLLKKKWFTTPQ